MKEILVETSARHIHLNEEQFKILFGEDAKLEVRAPLSQPGQFVSTSRLDVVGPKKTIAGVSILGPFRKDAQVEVSATDCRTLGVKPVIRESGDIKGSAPITLVGPAGQVELSEGCIVAKRHIHMTPLDASRARVKDNDEVFVITESYERGLIFADVVVRVSPKFKTSMHVDTDEANAFAGQEKPCGAILKLFDGQTYSLQQWADEIQSGINR